MLHFMTRIQCARFSGKTPKTDLIISNTINLTTTSRGYISFPHNSPFENCTSGFPLTAKQSREQHVTPIKSETALTIKITITHQEPYPSPVDPASSRAFLDLDYFSSDYSCCGTTFATAFASHCCTSCFSLQHCIHFGTTFATYYGAALLTAPPKRWAPACRSVRASANDKIENEEVAPRVTPVAAARRSRPYPRAHPLLRIGDPSPYAPSVDPTVRRSYGVSILRSYPLSSTSLNTVTKR